MKKNEKASNQCVCGESVRHPQKYCGNIVCYPPGHRKFRAAIRPCKTCGENFKPSKKNRSYCGDQRCIPVGHRDYIYPLRNCVSCSTTLEKGFAGKYCGKIDCFPIKNPNWYNKKNKNCCICNATFSAALSGKRHCSDKCREEDSTLIVNKRRAAQKPCRTCGNSFDNNRTQGSRYCSDECNPNVTSCFFWECSKPIKIYGGKNDKFCDSHVYVAQKKGFASFEELSLVKLLRQWGYEHSGNATFWITTQEGKRHNPDFVDIKNKRVVEYFGSYWHSKEDAHTYTTDYFNVGWDCMIIWDNERKSLLNGMLGGYSN